MDENPGEVRRLAFSDVRTIENPYMKDGMKRMAVGVVVGVASMAPLTLTQCTPYSQAVINQVDRVQQVTSLLKQVNDKSSADAVAPLVQGYKQDIAREFKEVIGTGEPSMLDLLVLRNKLKEEKTRTVAMDLVLEYIRLVSVNFYGSTALRTSFQLFRRS